MATIVGNTEPVETLVRLGADINARDKVSLYVCDEMSWSVSVTNKEHNPM